MMQKPQFNFVRKYLWIKSFKDIVLVVMAVVLAAIFCSIYLVNLNKYNEQLVKQAMQPVIPSTHHNPELGAQLLYFETIKTALNAPWMETLDALEKIKLDHPTIQFLAIEPNLSRKEITIKLKAYDFSEVAALVNSFRKSSRFGEAELVSQHSETSEEELFTVFDLRIRWNL